MKDEVGQARSFVTGALPGFDGASECFERHGVAKADDLRSQLRGTSDAVLIESIAPLKIGLPHSRHKSARKRR